MEVCRWSGAGRFVEAKICGEGVILKVITILVMCIFVSGCLPLLAAGGVNSIYGWHKDQAIEKRVTRLENECLFRTSPVLPPDHNMPVARPPRIWSSRWVH